MSDTCKDCRFFNLAWDGAGYGHCRRVPPVPILVTAFSDGDSASEVQPFWPEVDQDAWCGEFTSQHSKPAPSKPLAQEVFLVTGDHSIIAAYGNLSAAERHRDLGIELLGDEE